MNLKKWLIKPLKSVNSLEAIALALIFIVSYTMLATFILDRVGLLQVTGYVRSTNWPTTKYLIGSCLFPALWEEALYRYVPLTIAARVNKKKYLLPVMIGTSLLFGWDHHYGIFGVIFQGMLGFTLATLFVKTKFNYWNNVILHAVWNIISFMWIDNFLMTNYL